MRNLGREIAGGRVIRTQEEERMQAPRQIRRKLMALEGAVGWKAAALWRTGAFPAAGRGGAVSVISDAALRYCRQFAATLAGVKMRGGIAVYVIMDSDPLCDLIYDSTLGVVVKCATFVRDGRAVKSSQWAWAGRGRHGRQAHLATSPRAAFSSLGLVLPCRLDCGERSRDLQWHRGLLLNATYGSL